MLTPLFNKFSNKLKTIKTQYNGYIWHYTSSYGLKSIIENDCIWFSDRRFLNDKTECSYVYELINELLEDSFLDKLDKRFAEWIYSITNEFKEADLDCTKQDKLVLPCFVASFSIQDDNLNLWNYYTKNQQHSGYAFKIDTKKVLKDLTTKNLNIDFSFTNGKIIYSKVEQLAMLKDLLNEYNSFYKQCKINTPDFEEELLFFEIINLLDIYNLFYKPSSYEIEQEYRFVIVDMSPVEDKISTKKFRIYNDIFIPYIEYSNIKNLIEEIKISPSSNQQVLKNSLSIFTSNYNLKNVKISKSNIPMRY